MLNAAAAACLLEGRTAMNLLFSYRWYAAHVIMPALRFAAQAHACPACLFPADWADHVVCDRAAITMTQQLHDPDSMALWLVTYFKHRFLLRFPGRIISTNHIRPHFCLTATAKSTARRFPPILTAHRRLF